MSRPNLADVLRAEANNVDLQEDPNKGLVVCAQRQDGSLYELGSVSADACYQDPDGARLAIQRIKFAKRTAVTVSPATNDDGIST
jgi:hypothetical protein